MKGLKAPTNVFFSEANSAFLGYFLGKFLKCFQKKSFERVAVHFQISQHCKKIDRPQRQVLRSGDLILVYG